MDWSVHLIPSKLSISDFVREQILAKITTDWADHVIIQASADVLRRTLKIIHPVRPPRVDRIKPRTESRGTYYLGYTGVHYVLLKEDCESHSNKERSPLSDGVTSPRPAGDVCTGDDRGSPDVKDARSTRRRKAKKHEQYFASLEKTIVRPLKPFNDKDKGNKEGESAETSIHKMCEKVAKRVPPEPMEVIHSVKYDEAIDLRQFESDIDFLVLHKTCGPIIIEVKGAKEDDGAEVQKAFAQLRKHREVLRNELNRRGDHVGAEKVKDCRGIVALPFCEGPVKRSEVPNTVVWHSCVTRDSCADRDKVISCLKRGRGIEYSCETLDHLRRWVDGTGTSVSAGRLDKAVLDLHSHTQQRLKQVSKCDTRKKWIKGPAGSGKTWLLKMKVELLLKGIKDGKILVICYNNPLSCFLTHHFSTSENVVIFTYDRFLNVHLRPKVGVTRRQMIAELIKDHKNGKPTPDTKYQHIFVDEGQDLYGEWYELLECFLECNKSFYWVNYDPNQRVQPASNTPHKVQHHLKGEHELKVVLRNTKPIFDFFKNYCQDSESFKAAKSRAPHKVEYVKIREDEQICDVATYLRELIAENASQAKDIAVLTKDELSSKQLCMRLRLCSIDSQPCNSYPRKQAVVVDSIRRFKGLESKTVILVFLGKDVPEDNILYTGGSRGCVQLIVMAIKVIVDKIEQTSHWCPFALYSVFSSLQ